MLLSLVLSLTLIGHSLAQRGQNPQCVDRSNDLHSVYDAPARAVPFPRVDAQIKRGFLQLFHREFNSDHNHNTPFDPPDAMPQEPLNISQDIINQINELCPRATFFYSFAPRHQASVMLLQQQLMNQTTPAQVLSTSRTLLHSHLVNPRVWYYALLGTILMRPDLNGYYIAWAFDATPDLYVTNAVINEAKSGANIPESLRTTRQCTTSIGVQVTDIQVNSSATQQQQQQQQQPPQQRQGRQQSLQQQQEEQQRLLQGIFNFAQNNFQPTRYFNKRSAQSSGWGGYDYQVYYDDRVPRYSNQYNYRRPPPPGRTPNRQPTTPPPPTPPRRRQDECILYNGTRGSNAAENQLWYFREDIELLTHHWYWHQYFPQTSSRHPDRRGEVFYHAHHNIIARYNAERLSNGLPPETPLNLRLGANIGAGYNSDLLDHASGRFWTPRIENTPLSDIAHMRDRDFQLDITWQTIGGIFNNLTQHISQGFLLQNRSNNIFQLDIRNMEGLSHLGNTIEATEQLSTHPQFYHAFGVHNLGHIAVGLATDPDFRCEMPTGVMADLTVTMRDPAFFKVHTFTDDLFSQYKTTLPAYQLNQGEWPLQWTGVTVSSVDIVSGNGPKVWNFLRTFWSLHRFPLEEGVDGSVHEGVVNAEICHQHLDHEPFQFRLTIDVDTCARTVSRRGTVRLYMAPRYNLDGRRFTMEETRKLMFQLDAFPVDLRLGRNTITRNARDSSLTKPWSRNLQDMLRDPDNGGRTEYCGCGWPEHLYIPKGNAQGMEFDLFAMVTNYDQDQVQDTPEDLRIQEPCISAYLHCGIPYRRYPDARPMGYPFDRLPYNVVERGGRQRPVSSLEEYTANVNNMKSSILVIQHLDTIM